MCITAAMMISSNSDANLWLIRYRDTFTPVNERIATIRITAKFYNISLVCAHAPLEEKDDGVKYAF